MEYVIKNREPADVLRYFEEISAIPRGSGNEKAIGEYLLDFAAKLGLEARMDDLYNVVIKKPASPGCEHLDPVILQGHTDMVCEKNKNVEHDFTKDGIKLVVDGDILRADGTTLGAVYPDANGVDIYEKDLTLSISNKLAAVLTQAGYNVVLTRTGETAGDLYERSELANSLDADLFVSIHCNAAPTVPTFQGLYTYHYPSSTRGATFAQYVQDAAIAATGAIDRGISSANFVVLRETYMPAVLVECGFMTNVDELTLLCDESYQQKLADGIAQGVTDYLTSLEAAQAQAALQETAAPAETDTPAESAALQ